MDEGPIKRDGKVALVRYMPLSQSVEFNGKRYEFVDRKGVSLCWVDESDVGKVLEVTKQCCGGVRTRLFRYANQAQVNYWEM